MVGVLAIAMSGPLLAGCPIPFPSEVAGEADAGLNVTPVIVGATPADLAFHGPVVVVDRGDERIVTLTVSDADRGDTLHIRTYRDYEVLDPTPFLNDVEIPVTGEVDRVRDVSLSTWCAGLGPSDEDLHLLVAMVTDRAFLDCGTQPDECAGQPLFRELPETAESSTVSWIIKCNPPE